MRRRRMALMQVLLCLLLLAEIGFLVYDLPVPETTRTDPHLAELVSKSNDVRLQDRGSLVWSDIIEGKKLHLGQSVLTLESASAEIAFDDGSALTLDENSLVAIEKAPSGGAGGPIRISLLRGTLRRKSGGNPMEIIFADRRLQLAPDTELSIAATPENPGQGVVTVLSGTAQLELEGRNFSLASGQQASLGSGESPGITAPPVVLAHPLSGEIMDAGEKELEFRWITQKPSKGLVLELSTASGLGHPAHRLEIGESQNRIRIDRTKLSGSDNWFWRIRDIGSGFATPAERFHLTAPESRTPPAAIELKNPPAIPAPPPPSELLKPRFEHAPPPEKLKTSQRGSFLDWLFPLAHAEEPDAPPAFYNIVLRWKTVSGAQQYQVQIARTRNFGNLITEVRTSEAAWTWEYRPGVENSKGRVWYRVASVGFGGKIGAFSEPEPIEIPASILAAGKPQPAPEKKKERTLETTKTSPAKLPPLTSIETSGGSGVSDTVIETPLLAEERFFSWTFAAQGGVGTLSQKSGETDLKSVSMDAPFVHQRIDAWLELGKPQRNWKAHIETVLASFEKSDDSRASGQEPVSAHRSRLELYAWEKNAASWRLGLGTTLDWSFRWAKISPQAVQASSSLSLGPAAMIVRHYKGALANTGARIGMPLTGLISNGQAGAYGAVWGEWRLFTFQKRWIGLASEAQAATLSWKTPVGTRVSSYGLWLGLSLHSRQH